MQKTLIIILLSALLMACSGRVSETPLAVPLPTSLPSSPTHPAPPTSTAAPIATSPPAAETALPPGAAATITPLPVKPIPDSSAFQWAAITTGLAKPVGLTHAGDGSGRIFVIEQSGLIRVIQADRLDPQSFLDIRDRVGSQGFEQGLLGLAFHPDYPENNTFYVNYTDRDGNTVIARFQVSAADPGKADPTSEVQLLQVQQPYANHNGGEIAFGPDGYLYIGLGDGGSGGDPLGSGQSLATLLGKILRLNVNTEGPYAIPPDNPFINGEGRPEIWAYGLRNPWRFSFDRLTGDLYIGDVGQSQWEEINFLPAGAAGGANFGWNLYEGSHPFKNDLAPGAAVIPPIAEYDHNQGCSVTGGVVYRGTSLPAMQGVYLYGDYCSGNIWGLKQSANGSWENRLLFQGIGAISSFGEDEAGEVYLVDHRGNIFRLTGQ
ncbi:MAG: PQQ-dependent sugar dehydrogenase [Anaerolineales bacterium]|nr:PQQ-dependent sugar dehydrogenase [Anaerolineales bacterium]